MPRFRMRSVETSHESLPDARLLIASWNVSNTQRTRAHSFSLMTDGFKFVGIIVTSLDLFISNILTYLAQ
jgi:hypothetical protein